MPDLMTVLGVAVVVVVVAVALIVWQRLRKEETPLESPLSEHRMLRAIVDKDRVPDKFPTHLHESAFWEQLGRVVGTFGFLEETLARAIFALTATRPYHESEIQQAYAEWLPKLERALSDQLGNLIGSYERAVREHPGTAITNLDDLIGSLRKASEMRNVLCHGSWPPPDAHGRSVPFFVDRKMRVFDTAVDSAFLIQVQQYAAELACEVMNTVTHMGLQFPGSSGLGEPIWPS